MSAQLMGLVRELKTLNARKKAGEVLTPDEEARRKELKTFLKAQLEGAGGVDDEGSAVSPRPSPAPAPVSAPVPAASPAAVPPPRPAPSPPPPPMPVAPPPRPAPPPPPMTAAAPPPRPAPGVSAAPPPLRSAPLAEPAPPPRVEPPKFAGKKDAFAISGAASFIEAAMNSEAVAKVDPWAGRKAQASAAEVEDAEARADAALKANKKRERVTEPDQVEQQLREVQGGYTPPEPDHLVLEQYYGDYFGEGLSLAPVAETADLKPIDPRELELRRALDVTAGPASGATSATVPPGLAFLDDFSALYAKKVLPPPIGEVENEPADPSLLVGRRKVTVHMLNGEKKQGTIRALRRGELGFKLETPGAQEEIAIAQIKAVFVHLQPNAAPKAGAGRSVTVLFRDQRSVQGDTDDYVPGQPVFTLIPPAGRGQFEKIVVNAGAVASVS
jgi:hypothetical protein